MHSETMMLLSKCFAPVPEGEWNEVAAQGAWDEFLRSMSEDLSDCSERKSIIEAMSIPPTYSEKKTFAARHFTGGLPDSAMPIESLYTRKLPDDVPEYYQEPALYMKALIESMGYELPPEYRTYPDHLSLELEMLAILLDEDEDAAADFASSRFSWLPEFEAKLSAFGEEGAFYAAAVRAVRNMCI